MNALRLHQHADLHVIVQQCNRMSLFKINMNKGIGLHMKT